MKRPIRTLVSVVAAAFAALVALVVTSGTALAFTDPQGPAGPRTDPGTLSAGGAVPPATTDQPWAFGALAVGFVVGVVLAAVVALAVVLIRSRTAAHRRSPALGSA
jgi:hypothetical protein